MSSQVKDGSMSISSHAEIRVKIRPRLGQGHVKVISMSNQDQGQVKVNSWSRQSQVKNR